MLPKKLRVFQLETRQLYYCNPKEHVNKECMNVGTQSKKQYLLLENLGYNFIKIVERNSSILYYIVYALI